MTEEEALVLGQEIIDFLIECGGNYKDGVCEKTVFNVFFCLGSGQYRIAYDNKGIKWFVCFWKIWPEDVEITKSGEIPKDLTKGSTMYVAECGCRDKQGMAEIRKSLRIAGRGMKGILWRRPTKGTVYHFPRQEGA